MFCIVALVLSFLFSLCRLGGSSWLRWASQILLYNFRVCECFYRRFSGSEMLILLVVLCCFWEMQVVSNLLFFRSDFFASAVYVSGVIAGLVDSF